MFRDTNPIGNKRRRSQRKLNDGERPNGVRNYIVCYKCNNLGHIARNCRAPNNQNGTKQRKNAHIC